jgi:hypothetical protein
MSADALFRPLKLKGLNLLNRVVMAPMTRSFSPGGIPTQDVAQYYRRRAEGGVGLIISEGTGVDRPASLNDPNVPRFHGEKELAAWQSVVNEVHDVGGLMAPQLWHVEAVRTRAENWSPPGAYDSPSGLSCRSESTAEAVGAFVWAYCLRMQWRARSAGHRTKKGEQCIGHRHHRSNANSRRSQRQLCSHACWSRRCSRKPPFKSICAILSQSRRTERWQADTGRDAGLRSGHVEVLRRA